MQNPAPVFFSVGLALLILGSSGCAMMPAKKPVPMDFLVQAMNTDPRGRMALWQALPQTTDVNTQLKRALLRSVPGHPEYDPDGAREALQALQPELSNANATLVQLRLAEMRSLQSCYARQNQLQKRLDAIADIERQLGTGAR